MAAQPARASARTIDGELARRLSTLHSDIRLNYQTRGLNCLSEQVSAFTDNTIVALTCNHVVTSPYDRAQIPTALASEVAQPSLYDDPNVDGNLIGSIKRIVPILTLGDSSIP